MPVQPSSSSLPAEPDLYASDAARWRAVQARDPAADEHFWYSVRTTGVYCRPSCAARPALRENVAFHSSRRDAEAAGFRPCKRCKPDQPPLAQRQAQAVAVACRLIDQAEAGTTPDLATLAAAVGLSQHHLHRLFKAHTGLTPRAYADGRRAERMRGHLSGAASVTEAMYQAGFASSGRFYANSDAQLGMRPASFRQGGRGERIRFAVAQSWLGPLLVAATERGICTVAIDDDPEALVLQLQDRFPHAELVGADADFEALVARVVASVNDPRSGAGLPLDVRGTAFQQRVWQALLAVPAGATVTYSELAQRIGSPTSVRAVASACGANEIAILVPCHRVVRLDGSASGYRWGIARKEALLARELAGDGVD
ncbi:bifunctional DNA-binding transcriptional regulator/O6-methylguanine-DNA methyltransferase Ada [Herbaspirillum sp. alder98]|uniref:bifunctional DNA-binding transcriptional regulator/O6-methylguanine-DNA methyltransferase Ada n=1 Tax=Herbaspirillum sp. alder98 TaxID=2913096 RepID=UPI001CD89194|nr:bifunctional DNA-binding transcriptional regulator/O6-methylguanine-DNA methyltransferase Ada [Herbaspirillum sp. alder98]MCA1325457.1 bifunctional DNA-binding transcriptional regulator/O6-methylguanine-DNA methyltransferase Ada [Herbaspirillum sp. alder98]